MSNYGNSEIGRTCVFVCCILCTIARLITVERIFDQDMLPEGKNKIILFLVSSRSVINVICHLTYHANNSFRLQLNSFRKLPQTRVITIVQSIWVTVNYFITHKKILQIKRVLILTHIFNMGFASHLKQIISIMIQYD